MPICTYNAYNRNKLPRIENSEMMADVAHDLRSSLALIYSYVDMMHDFPAEATPDRMQVVMEEIKYLSLLASDMLEISQLESAGIALHLSSYNLTERLNDTIGRMAELLKKDGYTIAFAPSGKAYVKADEIKITQAFYNLLINAVHYSGADKHIAVWQSVTEREVKIAVVDRGDGIAPENLPHIWERYYKIERKAESAISGTGLGLSIVRGIIELHGGSYGVESTPGEGSAFWFALPLEHFNT